MRRRTPLVALAIVVLVACSPGEAAAPPPSLSTIGGRGEPTIFSTSVPTAHVGAPTDSTDEPPDETDVTEEPLDETDPTAKTDETNGRPSRRTTTTTDPPSTPLGDRPVGRVVDGNRLLMIGDSILASTAERYTGEMCARLVPLGWAVEIDAETGSQIDFGQTVLDARLGAGWDAAVVFLGSNYPEPPEQFAATLRSILDRLEPRPVLLFTVSENEERQAEVNYIVRTMARDYNRVRVVEWAELTRADDELTVGDGLHPTDAGRAALVALVARELGRAPETGDGGVDPACLPTQFFDDSL